MTARRETDLSWKLGLRGYAVYPTHLHDIKGSQHRCEEELDATLGYGPWSLAWWWMQRESDPLRRLTVLNSWGEPNLMPTLREWREQAEARGFNRMAELRDYLQTDKLTHVRLATRWIRQLTDDRPQ